jgi:hypothetical protein
MVPSSNSPRLAWPAFALAAALAASAFAVPAQATTIADPAGDFLATYTGPQNGDLDVLSVSAVRDATAVTFSATFNGAIGTTAGGVYVLGINRGAGLPLLTTGVPSVGAGVNFDAVAVLNPLGGSFVNLILPSAVGPTPLSTVTFSGSSLTAVIPFALLPSNGFATSDYLYNLWPRSGLASNVQIADFAPNASSFAADIPEPGAWALMIAGFGLMGAALRRRRPVAELAA